MSGIISFFLIILFVCSKTIIAQTIIYSQSSNGVTDWNDTSIWNDISTGSGTSLNAEGNDLIIQNGHTITINSNRSVNSITVEAGGTLNFDGTARTVSVINLTIENGGEFRTQTSGIASHTLNVTGDIINNGSFNMMPTATRTCKLIFDKNGNQNITGSDTLNLFELELNMGNSNSNILDVQNVITLPVNSINLINGTLKLSSPSEITPFSNDTIKATCGFILNDSDAVCSKGTQGGLLVNGLLEINSGLFEVGNTTGNELELNSSTAQLNVNGGSLNLSGRLRVRSSSNLNITGGEINLMMAGTGTSNETFRIQTSAKLNMSGGIINLSGGNNVGDISFTTDSDNINITGGTFILGNGTSSRKFEIDINSDLYNLTINNADSLIELQENLRLKGNLNLISGIILLGNFNLTLSETSSITGSPSSSRMIVANSTGKLIKELNTASSFTFPVGDIDGVREYSPVTINFLSGSFINGSVGVNVKNIKHPSVAFDASSYLNRYWNIASTGITSFNCAVSFNYVDADVNGTESNIYFGQWDTTWNILSFTDDINNILSDTISTFSDFTGAEQESFPVELISFSANAGEETVDLFWKTISEINNLGFQVERKDAELEDHEAEWENIGFIEGAGNSNSPKDYFYSDGNLNSGEKYLYRLKQIDANGKFSYSGEIEAEIKFTIKEYKLSQNYPNPFNPTTKIKYSIPGVEMGYNPFVQLKVYDILGKEISILVNEQQAPGNYEVIFDAINLANGIYFYKLTTPEFSSVRKMILLK